LCFLAVTAELSTGAGRRLVHGDLHAETIGGHAEEASGDGNDRVDVAGDRDADREVRFGSPGRLQAIVAKPAPPYIMLGLAVRTESPCAADALAAPMNFRAKSNSVT
jgi:hypothetical protein